MSVRWETEGLQTVGIVCLVLMFLKLMHLLGLIDITETGKRERVASKRHFRGWLKMEPFDIVYMSYIYMNLKEYSRLNLIKFGILSKYQNLQKIEAKFNIIFREFVLNLVDFSYPITHLFLVISRNLTIFC